MNLLQSRHRLNGTSAAEMERYVAECEQLTAHEYYSAPEDVDLGRAVRDENLATITWRSPIETKFERNNSARADFFWSPRGKNAPTVIMLHALMSATHIGYRRWAAYLNELGWNACFVHLPYHYSRVPRGYWNGELAITANLVRNAEGLRQGVMEVRQLIAALREAFGPKRPLHERATIVILSQRLAAFPGADRVVVLEHGRIEEEGTHDGLLARDGLYARIFRAQAQSSFALAENAA